jgi:predicted amidohydrolase
VSVVRVAAVQLGPRCEDVNANVVKAIELVESRIANVTVDLVVFPELFNSKFFATRSASAPDDLYEPVPGPTTDALGRVARSHGCTVVAGVSEITTSGARFNSAVVLGPDGTLSGVYRKRHLPFSIGDGARATYERTHFNAGNVGLPVFECGQFKIGILICYDRHFPEDFLELAAKGADFIVIPSAARSWNTRWRAEIWECLLRTRAYENGVFVIASNRAGTEDGTTYLGDSMIVSPVGGEVVSRAAASTDDDVVIAVCELNDVANFRSFSGFRDGQS